AVQHTVPPVAWLMLAANIAWAIAYDTEYAMVDKPDDLRLGLKTAAITFGRHDVQMVALCYCITLALLAFAGFMLNLTWPYYAGLVVAGGIAVQHIRWIRTRDR